MEPFTTLTGIAAPLDEANVDTNQLCPTRFNKQPRGKGFSKILLHDRRFNEDGSTNSDFVLNRSPYDRARILVSGRNFGCGSSRETAVWGLLDFGIRVVIAPTFGDIFVGNSYKNGLLPIILPADVVRRILDRVLATIGLEIGIDLERQIVAVPGEESWPFAMHPLIKRRLLRGQDEITLTSEYLSQIVNFEKDYHVRRSWLTRSGAPT